MYQKPTYYIIVCLPDIALILGGKGLSWKQKYRSYDYPGYNNSPYNSCIVIEMSFWPGRVYNKPSLSSYSPRSLEHLTGREQKDLMVTKQLAREALLVESSALALHQTSTKVYRGQASNLFPTQHSIFACDKELGGFIFCCNWRKTGYQDILCCRYDAHNGVVGKGPPCFSSFLEINCCKSITKGNKRISWEKRKKENESSLVKTVKQTSRCGLISVRGGKGENRNKVEGSTQKEDVALFC